MTQNNSLNRDPNSTTQVKRTANIKKILLVLVAALLVLGAVVFLLRSRPSRLAAINGERIVILDAGHGGKDIGASRGDVKESEINLSIAKKIEKNLTAKGYTVIMLRNSDEWIGLYSRSAMIHQYAIKEYQRREGNLIVGNALLEQLRTVVATNDDKQLTTAAQGPMYGYGVSQDLAVLFEIERDLSDVIFVSVHTNAMENKEVYGVQVITTDAGLINKEEQAAHDSGKYPNFPSHRKFSNHNEKESHRLASSIYHTIIKKMPASENKAITGMPKRNLAVLREQCLPSVLVEIGFLTNDAEYAKIRTEAYQTQMADAITEGIVSYFK